MAWTAPRTWVAAEIVTAALLNTHLRDNLLETGVAKVTTAGDLAYATAATALARLGIGSAMQVLRTNAGATAPEWGAPQSARAYHNATQSVADNDTAAVLSFNTEDYDTDAIYDGGSPTLMTFKTAGKYLIATAATWAGNVTGRRSIQIQYNTGAGAQTLAGVTIPATATGDQEIAVAAIYNASVNHTVRVHAYQNSGAPLNVQNNSSYHPYLAVVRVA